MGNNEQHQKEGGNRQSRKTPPSPPNLVRGIIRLMHMVSVALVHNIILLLVERLCERNERCEGFQFESFEIFEGVKPSDRFGAACCRRLLERLVFELRSGLRSCE